MLLYIKGTQVLVRKKVLTNSDLEMVGLLTQLKLVANHQLSN